MRVITRFCHTHSAPCMTCSPEGVNFAVHCSAVLYDAGVLTFACLFCRLSCRVSACNSHDLSLELEACDWHRAAKEGERLLERGHACPMCFGIWRDKRFEVLFFAGRKVCFKLSGKQQA